MEKKNTDLKEFKKFVQDHKPNLIVIDAGGLNVRSFKKDVENILIGIDNEVMTNGNKRRKRVDENGYELDEISMDIDDDNDNDNHLNSLKSIRVEFVDPCVSILYRNSDDADSEFETWPINERQAVSLGRFVLSPIVELCNRWNVDNKTGKNELLSLPLHPNMNDVPNNKLLNSFRKCLIDEVNHIGVEINLMLNRPWLTGVLKFVNGLGEYKAKNILKILQENNIIIKSRKQELWTKKIKNYYTKSMEKLYWIY